MLGLPKRQIAVRRVARLVLRSARRRRFLLRLERQRQPFAVLAGLDPRADPVFDAGNGRFALIVGVIRLLLPLVAREAAAVVVGLCHAVSCLGHFHVEVDAALRSVGLYLRYVLAELRRLKLRRRARDRQHLPIGQRNVIAAEKARLVVDVHLVRAIRFPARPELRRDGVQQQPIAGIGRVAAPLAPAAGGATLRGHAWLASAASGLPRLIAERTSDGSKAHSAIFISAASERR